MKKWRLFKGMVFCFTVMMLFALAGCGGNKEAETDPGTDSGGSDEIKVGFLGPMSGDYAEDGQEGSRGAQMVIDQVNASGGIDGKMLKLVIEDDRGDSTDAVNAVQKLLDQEQVDVMLAASYSSPVKTIAQTLDKRGIPTVVSIATHQDITKDVTHIFRVVYTALSQGQAAADYAVNDMKYKKFAVLGLETDMAKACSDAFIAYVEAHGGEIVYQNTFKDNDKDFAPLLTAVKNAQPDAIYAPSYSAQGAAIAVQCKQLGISLPLIGSDGWDSPSTMLGNGKDAVNGLVYTTSFSVEDQRPIVQEFLKNYKAKYDRDPSMVTAQGYDAMAVLVEALKNAGGAADKEAVTKALGEIKDFKGVTATFTFTPQHEVIRDIVLIQIKDQKLTYIGSKVM